jgi:prevent-host-death family protein
MSMAVQVNIYEAKTRLSQLVDQAAAGEDVIIARNGRPVARLVPIQRQPERRVPGSLRGKIWMAPDFDETDPGIIEAMENGPVFPDDVR